MKVREAEWIAERDDIGKCLTCNDLALEGDNYCFNCRDYWENDALYFDDNFPTPTTEE